MQYFGAGKFETGTMFVSVVVVGALTCCALLHLVCDLKAAQMNMQYSLIQELMLYKFKLGHNAMEATKNICCMQDESSVHHSNQML